MSDEFFVPDICRECMNANGFGECCLMPSEQKVCLEEQAMLFIPKEGEE